MRNCGEERREEEKRRARANEDVREWSEGDWKKNERGGNEKWKRERKKRGKTT